MTALFTILAIWIGGNLALALWLAWHFRKLDRREEQA